MITNQDFTKRAYVNSNEDIWHKSPADGVERLYLERDDGGEYAIATTIVRFDPGSKFEQHVHDGGEEFLVLDGVFSDEFGSYPKGTYVRNPKGSAHNPFSESGCMLFVKLRQFQKHDNSLLKTYINPGLVFVILGVSDWFLNFSDKLIIGFYLDPLQLSVYFTIGLISSSILSLGSIYWWELLPKLNEYQSKKRYDKIFKLIKDKNESFIYLSNILIILLIIFSPSIQSFVLNKNIEMESYFYLIFFSSIFFHQISTGWEFFCYIENKGSFVLKNSIFWGLFSFLMYVVLIPEFGIYGALFTLFTSKTLSSICLKRYANKFGYNQSILKRNFVTYLIPFASSISFFIILKFFKFFNFGIIWDSIIYFTISAFTFCSLFGFFKKSNI